MCQFQARFDALNLDLNSSQIYAPTSIRDFIVLCTITCKHIPCHLIGDIRVNEQPNLAIIHTLFVREHNRIAKELKIINSQWSDEKLFQETKRIVNAQYQFITYNEW